MARGVPVVSARQMLTWLDGRNGSSFEDLAWNGGTLTFCIAVGAGANGLQAMLPTSGRPARSRRSPATPDPSPSTRQTIKGIEYAVFSAAPATTRRPTRSTRPPAISADVAAVRRRRRHRDDHLDDRRALGTRVDYGTSAGTRQTAEHAW